ncbi:MAG: metal-dependent transcriptional regulator [Clostridia bacterium]|nr:metal-dependent transcriptional regulator [Clostridia bacterium]MBR0444417.1 metal-dependent transcriptional regulator [Clostridia bacterium]
MKINESAEDYLEAILIFQIKNGAARSVDVARHLGVTKPSVSHAMKLLRENGYIHMDKDSAITLSDSGRAIAEGIYNRHKELAGFLMRLGVDETIAFQDACKMEHDLHEESFQAILACSSRLD